MRKPCLVFLGTAAAIPSISRFAPAIAIAGLKEAMLLDVGEGTQLRLQEAGLGLSKIKIIAVSHLHGDHFLGLFPLLQSLWMQIHNVDKHRSEAKISIISPDPSLCQALSSTPFVECTAATNGYIHQSSDFVVTAIKVNHGEVKSFGYHVKIVVDSRKRKYVRLFYSGDGICEDDCVEILRSVGVDVVIHDATFTSLDDDRARASFHATARDAALLARELGAKLLILTHVSARYGSYLIDVAWDARRFFRNCIVASDLMYVPLAAYASVV